MPAVVAVALITRNRPSVLLTAAELFTMSQIVPVVIALAFTASTFPVVVTLSSCTRFPVWAPVPCTRSAPLEIAAVVLVLNDSTRPVCSALVLTSASSPPDVSAAAARVSAACVVAVDQFQVWASASESIVLTAVAATMPERGTPDPAAPRSTQVDGSAVQSQNRTVPALFCTHMEPTPIGDTTALGSVVDSHNSIPWAKHAIRSDAIF